MSADWCSGVNVHQYVVSDTDRTVPVLWSEVMLVDRLYGSLSHCFISTRGNVAPIESTHLRALTFKLGSANTNTTRESSSESISLLLHTDETISGTVTMMSS